MLKMSSTRINAQNDTSDHGLSHPYKAPGAAGEMSVHLQLELDTLEVLSVLPDTHVKELRSTLVGLYLEKCLRTYIDVNYFPWFFFFLWETHYLSSLKHFRYTLYNHGFGEKSLSNHETVRDLCGWTPYIETAM
jgi:hypothetical protein